MSVEELKKEIEGLKAGHKTLTEQLQFAHVRLNRAFDDAWHGKALDRASLVDIKSRFANGHFLPLVDVQWLIEQVERAHRHIEQIKQKLQLKKHDLSQYQKNSWANYCRQVLLDKKRRRTVEFNQILRQKLKDLKAKNHELRQVLRNPLREGDPVTFTGAKLDAWLAEFGFERFESEGDREVRIRFVDHVNNYSRPMPKCVAANAETTLNEHYLQHPHNFQQP